MRHDMTIDEIIQDCGPVLITGDKGTAVTSICSDSRKASLGVGASVSAAVAVLS